MAIFRQYIAPLIVVLIFALALVAVSARIFISEDMAAPAPVEEEQVSSNLPVAPILPSLDALVQGLPDTTFSAPAL